MIKDVFLETVSKCTPDISLAANEWEKIEKAYSNTDRHFHTLSHLAHLYTELHSLHEQIADWDSLVFSLVYHDFVYDVTRYMTENDNEEKSAEAAKEFLSSINYSADKIDRVITQILATKKHQISTENDTNIFTDADLSIWGQSWEIYTTYMNNVRKEYAIYPDNIFNAGRTKFLKTALQNSQIFKTDHFFQQYEVQARENLNRELEILSFS